VQDTCAIDANGQAKTSPGLTCKTIKDNFPNSASGVYWIKPDANEAFQVFCDMDYYGGGWTLVEMIGSNLNNRNGESYPDLGDKENKLKDSGLNFGAYAPTESASLGSHRVNAIWAVHGERTVIRTRHSRNSQRGGCTEYWLQRLNVDSDWDLFHAIRDTRDWTTLDKKSAYTGNRAYRWGVDQSGTTIENFRVQMDGCYPADASPGFYNKDRHHLIGSLNTWNAGMYWWDAHQITTQGRFTVEVSRHGIFGDVNAGCTWMFVFNADRTQSFCRTDVRSFVLVK